ncbi:MAG: hypothetical protein LKF31_01460 [Muribaculaceae bacterium]|jgi:hypothetical protein|nr:hypothetical protein [Muribaculaceae bacterium]
MKWQNLIKNDYADFKSHFTFPEYRGYVKVEGIEELSEFTNALDEGEGIVSMRCEKGDGRIVLININKGIARLILDSRGQVLIDDSEINYRSITENSESGICVYSKQTPYYFGLYTKFEDGLNALCWTTCPDGQFYADEDGFGAESNAEEDVYCIINTDLDIIVPFQPMSVKSVLITMRMANKS